MSDLADGYHGSVARPITDLQGGQDRAPEIMPCHGKNQDNPRSAGLDNIKGSWADSSLTPTPEGNKPNNPAV